MLWIREVNTQKWERDLSKNGVRRNGNRVGKWKELRYSMYRYQFRTINAIVMFHKRGEIRTNQQTESNVLCENTPSGDSTKFNKVGVGYNQKQQLYLSCWQYWHLEFNFILLSSNWWDFAPPVRQRQKDSNIHLMSQLYEASLCWKPVFFPVLLG